MVSLSPLQKPYVKKISVRLGEGHHSMKCNAPLAERIIVPCTNFLQQLFMRIVSLFHWERVAAVGEPPLPQDMMGGWLLGEFETVVWAEGSRPRLDPVRHLVTLLWAAVCHLWKFSLHFELTVSWSSEIERNLPNTSCWKLGERKQAGGMGQRIRSLTRERPLVEVDERLHQTHPSSCLTCTGI